MFHRRADYCSRESASDVTGNTETGAVLSEICGLSWDSKCSSGQLSAKAVILEPGQFRGKLGAQDDCNEHKAALPHEKMKRSEGWLLPLVVQDRQSRLGV